MLGQRVSELLQKGNPPFINAQAGFGGGIVRGWSTYIISTTAKPNEEAAALEAIYRENERVKKFGFTEGELERAKTNMLVCLESAYNKKTKLPPKIISVKCNLTSLREEPIIDFD